MAIAKGRQRAGSAPAPAATTAASGRFGRRFSRERLTALAALSPSVIVLLLWMAVPLGMTVWFSLERYFLLQPGMTEFIGLANYTYFLTNPAFLTALWNTFVLVGSVLVITVGGGIGLALLLNQQFWGRGVARILAISPFFIMPTVSALIWKHLLMDPTSGFFAWLLTSVGLEPVIWFADWPMLSIIIIVGWRWLPFATLILLTALQSLDEEQREAAEMDGAGPLPYFANIVLPHLARAITVVILIETIFLLVVFAEIYVTTAGGPGLQTTNIAFLIYAQALLHFDVGGASAGGVIAVVIANIAAIFLMRLVGRNLEE